MIVFQTIKKLFESRWAFLTLLVLALLLHLGTTIRGGLYADDYIHAAIIQGSPILEDNGLLAGMDAGTLKGVLSNQFNFFRPDGDNYQAMFELGVLPWWTGEDAQLHFFRPLASLSHWLDYQLWPENTHLMHFHSLVWYLLGLIAIYVLYKKLGMQNWVACLALFFIILDNSIFQVVTWVASRSMLMVVFFGFFALYCYHQSLSVRDGAIKYYIGGLLSLCLACFSAEAVVAICAYLGAYMLVYDKRPLLNRIIYLLPYALLVIVWRLIYQSGGFGAFGVDFYVDPGTEPIRFAQRFISLLPGNFLEMVAGVDVLSGQLRPDIKSWFAIPGVLLFAMITWLVYQTSKDNKLLVFFYLSSCLSLIPGLSITLSTRVMIIPFIGMAAVFAILFQNLIEDKCRGIVRGFTYFIVIYSFLFHGLVSGALDIYMAENAIKASGESIDDNRRLGLGDASYEGKHLVYVNVNRPFWLAFIPYQLAHHNKALPASVRVLANSFYQVDLKRVDEATLILTGGPGLQYDTVPLTTYENRLSSHFAYLTQELLGLIRHANDPWHEGDIVELPEMSVKVDRLYQGKPKVLVITLKQKADEMLWLYWDISERRYSRLELPAIGEALTLNGFFREK